MLRTAFITLEGSDMMKKVKSRQARKEVIVAPPSLIRLAVVMTGGPDTTKGSLVLSTDSGGGIIFNCGEGSIRYVDMDRNLREEAGVMKSNLRTIFITHKSWECIAGLHGLALSNHRRALNSDYHNEQQEEKGLSDFDIELFGPDGIEDYIHMTKNISKSQTDQPLQYKTVHSKGVYEDSAFTISSIVFEEEKGNLEAKKRSKEAVGQETVFAYIIKAHPMLPRLNFEKCVDLGFTSGAAVVDLVNGMNVTLADGRVITHDMVVDKAQGDERPILIIDCPNKHFLKSVTSSKDLEQYMTLDPAKSLAMVCHFTPSEIYNTDDYQAWMKRYITPQSYTIFF